jgi:tetratricopeptide (TPR) repeat protein
MAQCLLIGGALAPITLTPGCASRDSIEYPSTEALAPDDSEQIASIEARAPRIVAETIHLLGEQFGGLDPSPENVRVEIGMGLGGRVQGGWRSARTSGWGDSVQITLSTEFFVSGTMDLGLTARHEAVHAYLRSRLGSRLYKRIPPWFQEGVAIHLAGQSDAKIAEFIYDNPLEPEAKLAGLEAEESIRHHGEYALALRFIDTFPGGVTAVLRRLLDGEDVHDAIESVTGLENRDFLQAARDDAETRVKRMVASAPEAYLQGIACYREGQFDLAMASFERVFTKAGIDLTERIEQEELGRKDRLSIWALARWAGIAASQSDRLTEAVTALSILLTLSPYLRGERASKLRYCFGQALRRQGHREEALAEYARVIRFHPESQWRQDAAWAITMQLFALERYDEALEWAAVCDEPETSWLLYVRGHALHRLGSKEAGLELLRQFVELNENNPKAETQVRKSIALIESGQGPTPIRSGASAPGTLRP